MKCSESACTADRADRERHILVVDDEDMFLNALKRMLERFGYRVTAFTGGPEALTAFEAEPESFDLVISDRAMPRMSGEQLVRKILSIRPDVPILFITGLADPAFHAAARALGAREVILKPVTTSDLTRIVGEALPA
jgi:CheY-like chemotaxis protein